MIIYSEDLASTGFSVSDLAEGDSQAPEWTSISKSLHERALASFAIK